MMNDAHALQCVGVEERKQLQMTTMTAKPMHPAPVKGSSKRIYNFSAGPAVLPEEVLRQCQQDIWNIFDSGIGIMEHSHRGPVFDRVIDEAVADCRTIANISDDYEILFLQGGATLQFAMIPMSFLPAEGVADYIDTGVWANKALKEAKLFGKVNVAFDGSKSHYTYIPSSNEISLTPNAAYTHYCSNNTIYGTEWSAPPNASTPLVCDASSDIFSRPIDVNKFALIYAGAQKNLGPSGVVLVILRKDFIAKAKPGLPTMLTYANHAKEGSRLNTPAAFGIYVMGQVFKWILNNGGLDGLYKRNQQKAQLIYDAIDASGGFYTPHARKDSRSLMNITFRLGSEDLEKKFLKEAQAREMDGLKGHRNVGGIRASVYNAFPIEGCTALAEFMREFAKKNG
jgi:phosphoserine aminotransferase